VRALLARVSIAVLASALGFACGSGGGAPAKLSVIPETATVTAGSSPIAFTATLTGSSAPIIWTLAPAEGVGTLSATSGPTTSYTPPASVPGERLVTITASAGTLQASAIVRVQPITRSVEVLGVGGWPRQVVVAGGHVFWSDLSDEPLKSVPTAGGTPTVVAHRVERVAGLEVRAPDLVWLDLRNGTAPSGCSGRAVIGALVRSAVDGTGVTQIALGDACGGAEGPIVDGADAFWITSTFTPPQWTLRQASLDGGVDTPLVVSSQTLRGLTRNADALYWYQGSFPEGGSIVRRPLAGGDARVVVAGDVANPLSGVFTVSDGEVFFVELAIPYPGPFRIARISTGGGTPSPVAEFSNRPYPAALRASGGDLLWAEGDRLVAFSIASGTERDVLVGAGEVLGFLVHGRDAIVAVTSWASHAGPATLLRVPLDGGSAATLAGGLEPVGALGIDGAHLYWAESSLYDSFEGSGRLARVPLAGGAAETLLIGVAPNPRLAAGGGRLWIGDGFRVKSVGLDGGGLAQLVHLDGGVGDLEYTSYGGGSLIAMRGLQQAVVRISTDGGSPVVVELSPTAAPRAMSVGGSFVYWIEYGDQIWRVPEGGGEVQQVAAGLAAATDLVADRDHVFVYENDAGRITRIPASGGPADVLSGAPRFVPTLFALDGSWLYWVNPFDVSRVPKAGGLLEPVFPIGGNADPTAITLDDASVYITLTTLEGGGVAKITPK
jgi:hypothetical protein